MRDRRPGSRTRGQVLAEFCLILPLMIMLFAAIIDIGFYLLVNISLHTAVREGAQLAIYDGAFTVQQIKNRIKDSTYGATIADSEITVDLNTQIVMPGGTTYRAFYISVTHDHQLLVPFILSQQKTVTLHSAMRSLIVTGLTP